MADEKLNTTPADAPATESPVPGKALGQAAEKAPAQDVPAKAPGDVVVSADQIEKLMAQRNAKARAEVDKAETPLPEQPSGKAPEQKAPAEPKAAKAEKGKAAVDKADGDARPKRTKGATGNREGREPAGAARLRLARRLPSRTRPRLGTKCPKAREAIPAQ